MHRRGMVRRRPVGTMTGPLSGSAIVDEDVMSWSSRDSRDDRHAGTQLDAWPRVMGAIRRRAIATAGPYQAGRPQRDG